jgi:hypothetical protein
MKHSRSGVAETARSARRGLFAEAASPTLSETFGFSADFRGFRMGCLLFPLSKARFSQISTGFPQILWKTRRIFDIRAKKGRRYWPAAHWFKWTVKVLSRQQRLGPGFGPFGFPLTETASGPAPSVWPAFRALCG